MHNCGIGWTFILKFFVSKVLNKVQSNIFLINFHLFFSFSSTFYFPEQPFLAFCFQQAALLFSL